MSNSFLYKMGGLALILSGTAYLADTLLDVYFPNNMLGVGIFVSLFGLYGLTAVFLYQYENEKMLGFLAYVFNFTGLSGLIAIAYFNNLVKPKLDTEVIQKIVSGEVLVFFIAVGITFLIGSLLMSVTVWRRGKLPKAGAVFYGLGAIPVSLPPLFPQSVIEMGGVAISIALILWGARLLLSVTTTEVEYV